MYNFDEGLARTEALIDFLPYGALFDAVNEFFDNRQRDIGFQQSHTHFAQGIFDVVVGQTSTATDVAQRGG